MQSFSKMALWSSYKQYRKMLVSTFLCFDTRFDNTLRSWKSIYKIVHRPFLKMIAQVGCRHSSVDSSAPSILMPGFKSQAHHLCYNQLQSNLSLHCEKNKNKQKRPGLVHLKMIAQVSLMISSCKVLDVSCFTILVSVGSDLNHTIQQNINELALVIKKKSSLSA